MEPGSPWHFDREVFGVKTSLENFIDFYHYHSGQKNAFSSSGYWIPNYFRRVEDERVLRRHCRRSNAAIFASSTLMPGNHRIPFGEEGYVTYRIFFGGQRI